MVGRGYLKPYMTKLRADTPEKLRQLMLDCCKYSRDDRPEFARISPALETLAHQLPKLIRCSSEPLLICPKTPVHGGGHRHGEGAFGFLTQHNNAVL